MRSTILPLALALAIIATGARAEHCPNGWPPPSDPTVVDHCRTVNTIACVYIDYDLDESEPGCDGSDSLYVMLYQESNGIPGYQRGDECQDDSCHGTIEADTIFF